MASSKTTSTIITGVYVETIQIDSKWRKHSHTRKTVWVFDISCILFDIIGKHFSKFEVTFNSTKFLDIMHDMPQRDQVYTICPRK